MAVPAAQVGTAALVDWVEMAAPAAQVYPVELEGVAGQEGMPQKEAAAAHLPTQCWCIFIYRKQILSRSPTTFSLMQKATLADLVARVEPAETEGMVGVADLERLLVWAETAGMAAMAMLEGVQQMQSC